MTEQDRYVIGSFHTEAFDFLVKEVPGINGNTRLKFLSGDQYYWNKRIYLFFPAPLNWPLPGIEPSPTMPPGRTLTLEFFEFGYYNYTYWVAYDKQENVLYEYV